MGQAIAARDRMKELVDEVKLNGKLSPSKENDLKRLENDEIL